MNQHLRNLALNILDDDHGISENAWGHLSEMLASDEQIDIAEHIDATEGRFYLKATAAEFLRNNLPQQNIKQTINLDGEQVIVIETDGQGGGNMTAIGLREACPDCGEVNCERDCPQQAERQDGEREDEKDARLLYNAVLHGVESFLLALACAGVKVNGPEFHSALQTVLDAAGNKYS